MFGIGTGIYTVDIGELYGSGSMNMWNIKAYGRPDALLGSWVYSYQEAANWLIKHFQRKYGNHFYIVQFTGEHFDCCVGEPHIHCQPTGG